MNLKVLATENDHHAIAAGLSMHESCIVQTHALRSIAAVTGNAHEVE
jgi:spore coat polysaccharide biosynthesis predicted glycosyltransferase SpsG